MIGKAIPAKGAEGGRGFKGAVEYISQDAKVEYVLVSGVSSIDNAIADMQTVASMNSHVDDPVYHFVVSWPAHEVPSQEQVQQAVQMQLSALGYARHQWVAAFHSDTDNAHVHVVVNKVRPESFRAHHPRGDFFIMDRVCREIEVAEGRSHSRGHIAWSMWATARSW